MNFYNKVKIPAYKPQTIDTQEPNNKYKGSQGDPEEEAKDNFQMMSSPIQATNIIKKGIKVPSLKV